MDIVGNLDSITDDDDVTPIISIDYVDYVDKTKSFTLNQCKISIQGTSSQMYPVKNYTIQLRANGQEWLYSPKDEWIAESRFTLKANYIDSSSANNISNARFFNDMIKAYHPYPSQQTNDLCRGAVDGFPIRLYINNEYQGLYTFNIDRYANYLKRFSNETQFIVITHRKPTMEVVDALYGVTMEEKGVSKIVSVKLADAVKVVEAE